MVNKCKIIFLIKPSGLSSPNLVEHSSPHWIRFNKNSCYKNLIYFKCVYWYFYWVYYNVG